MASKSTWFIGNAGGALWYTEDAGVNWVRKDFPGSGTGEVRDIKFATNSVGFMAHDSTAPLGRILRTINGGQSWTVEPLSTLSIPANDRINALAVSIEDPNVVYAGGLADDAVDGIIIKGEGPTD
jgi:photosystem II stability/assembly factor-like uncharacterized protein